MAESRSTVRRSRRLLFLIWLALGASASGDQTGPASAPAKIWDFTVVSGESGGAVLVAVDLEGGGVYQADAAGAGSPFHLLYASPDHRRPAALAAREGKVVVAFQEPPAVVEIDLAGRSSVLWQGEPLRRPGALAALDDGTIAIADSAPEVLLLREEKDGEARGGWRIRASPLEGVAAAERLIAAGKELLVHDSVSGAIRSARWAESGRWEIRTLLPDGGREPLGIASLSDFAFYRGIFYVTDTRRLSVFARTEPETFELPPADRGNLSRLVATKDRLFALDRRTGRITREPRPVPSVAKLEGGPANATRTLAALVRNLACRGLIGTRQFTVGGQAMTVEEALVSRGLYPGRPRDKSSTLQSGQRVPVQGNGGECPSGAGLTVAEAWSETLCRLDPRSCSTASRKAPKPLSRILKPGERVLLPDVEVRNYLAIRYVDLDQRPVSEHLAERIPSPELRSKVDAAYISGINAASFRTSEAVLTRLGFFQATPPRTDLQPGAILRFRKGGESVENHLSTCSSLLSIAVKPDQPLRVPRPIEGDPESGLLPGRPASRELAQWEVAKIELTFDEAVVESIDRSRMEALLSGGEAEGCKRWARDSGHFLVVEALKLLRGRYRFLRKDGSVVFPTQKELAQAGIRGRSGEEEGWSLVVEEPLYLGYRLVPWDLSDTGTRWNPEETSHVLVHKVNSPQALLAQEEGRLNLPIEAWRASLLLPAGSIQDRAAFFPEIEARGNDLILLSTEDLLLEAQAVTARQDGPPPGPAWSELESNRRHLREEIAYEPEMFNRFGIVVGVAENREHVDLDHPAFKGRDNSYAWIEITEDGQFQPVIRPSSTNLPPPQIRGFTPSDHGTHVAGLIGAKGGNLGPGLLPHSELLLLDTANAARFHGSLLAAAARGEVSVLNFSFSYSRRDAPDELLSIMRNTTAQGLFFVVAAGNDGQTLGGFQLFPVCWADEIQNMIGVGASNWNKQLMGSWVDPDGGQQKGSNSGEKYVHLLAPGFEIYSIARNNAYAKQSGTSQAAPLVSSVAAVLAQDLTQPLRVKARLIYTADWYPHLHGKVWGGLLNARRALWSHGLNLVWTQTEADVPKAIYYKRSPEFVTLHGGEFYDQFGEPNNIRRNIPFRNVLRITLGDGGRFRVIYLDEGTRKMRILLGATLSGNLQCERFQRWDGVKFVDDPGCEQGFDVGNIKDYVAKTPSFVRF